MAQSTTNREQVESESERVNGPSAKLIAQVGRNSSSLPDSPPDWLSLDEHEELLWKDSPSPKTILSTIGLGIVVMGVGVTLVSITALQLLGELPSSIRLVAAVAGVVFLLAGISFPIIDYRSYQRRHYALTTEAIYRRWVGSTTEIGLESIGKVSCEQSWLDRQFSCGDIRIGWSEDGREKVTYPAVPHPNQVRELVSEAALEQRSRGKDELPE